MIKLLYTNNNDINERGVVAMRTTAKAPFVNQQPLQPGSSDPYLHEYSDRKPGYSLFIWAFAIAAQALLCVWIVIQASNPPLQ